MLTLQIPLDTLGIVRLTDVERQLLMTTLPDDLEAAGIYAALNTLLWERLSDDCLYTCRCDAWRPKDCACARCPVCGTEHFPAKGVQECEHCQYWFDDTGEPAMCDNCDRDLNYGSHGHQIDVDDWMCYADVED